MDTLWSRAAGLARWILGVLFFLQGWLCLPAWADYFQDMSPKGVLLMPVLLGALLVLQIGIGLALMLGFKVAVLLLAPMTFLLVPAAFVVLHVWVPPVGYRDSALILLQILAMLAGLMLLLAGMARLRHPAASRT